MKGLTKSFAVYVTFAIFSLVFLVIFTNTASANAEIDAEVMNTESLASAPVSLTRKAPVSITNYSDIITESADTYDYSNLNVGTTTTDIPEATQAPIFSPCLTNVFPSSEYKLKVPPFT